MPRLQFSLLLLLSSINAMAATTYPPNYDETRVPAYTLPDPLLMKDGTRVRDAAMWQARRRPKLLAEFADEIYGRTPTSRSLKIHWAVTATDRTALGGKAVRKEVTIWLTENKDGPRMHLLIHQPAHASAAQPVPAFLGLNFHGNHSVIADSEVSISLRVRQLLEEARKAGGDVTEPVRGSHAARWAVEEVVARGYATATIHYQEICRDDPEELVRDVGAVFGTSAVDDREPAEWGAIGMWAWGLSRALDYLMADPEIDGTRVAVIGHSRLGKAALWAGAQDERFAMVISNDSGCGGAALSRRAFGETVAHINTRFPHWFSRRFRHYNQAEDKLPVDQHELIALIAPRPVYVASAEEDLWADPRGEFLSTRHAEPVYALFGKKGLGISDMPAVNQPVLGDGVAYHIRTGKHDITPYDWAQYLDFADRVLKAPKDAGVRSME